MSDGKTSFLSPNSLHSTDPTGSEATPTESGTTQALDLAYASTLATTPPDMQDPVRMSLLIGHAKAMDLTGDWPRALSLFEEALTLAETLDQPSACADIWRQIGRIRRKQGQWAWARRAHEHSVSAYTSLNDATGIAAGHNSLGAVYMEEGALPHAQRRFEKALSYLEGSNDHLTRGQILNNLGIVANMRGQWDKAITNYQEALTFYDRIADHTGLARAYQNLGMTYADRDDWSQAADYFEKSLDIARRIGDHNQKALVYLNKIEVYIHFEDMPLALIYCQKCIQLFSVSGDYRGITEVCKLLGIVFRKKQDWTLARNYFRLALRLSRKYRLWLTMGEVLHEQGLLLVDQQKIPAALQSLEDSLVNLRKAGARGEMGKVQRRLTRLRTQMRKKR